MIKHISLNKGERAMLIEAAISFRQADKDSIACGYSGGDGKPITKATLKKWAAILRKLRARSKKKGAPK